LLHAQAGHGKIVVLWQRIGLWLLLIVAAPSVPGLLGPDERAILKFNWHQADLSIRVLLGIAGFFAIALALRQFKTPAHWVTLAIVMWAMLAVAMIVYGISGVVWAWYSWPASSDMPPTFAYLFAVMKSIYTLAFGSIIAFHGMPTRDQELGPRHWIRLFAGDTIVGWVLDLIRHLSAASK
jgi:hypothetical protein